MAALGSVNFGFNIGVINVPGDVISGCVIGPQHYIGPFPSCIPTADALWGVAVGCFALGALIGSIASNPIADKYGRKFALTWGPLFSTIGALLLSLSTTLTQFIFGRIFVGIAAGICNTAVSVYISEITTPSARTILGNSIQLATNLGILLSQSISLGLSRPPLWRVLFALTGVIGIGTTVLFPTCVESPKWLVSRGQVGQARYALTKLREGADVEAELADIVDADMASKSGTGNVANANVFDVLLGRTPDNLRHQLMVVSMGMFSQQLSGINAVIFYSTTIFNRTTHDNPAAIPTMAQKLTYVIAVVAEVFTFVGMLLCMRFGRRTLMLASSAAMAISSILMAVGSIKGTDGLVIAMVFVFNISFNFGVGPLPWVAAAEMTPAYAMSAMSAIGGVICYAFTFTIGVFFPPMQVALGDYTFLFFAGFNIATFVFCFFFWPETKGRKVEDIAEVHSVGIHFVIRDHFK
ncbi:general substrate transporter [Linderina pennispora]|uniref:General substrate transporter n=1 Tax=Linderina pennispora TaxID=61395 RepID=A0A1Y1W155_9FUNG|nr:general substrate transporter [Linderina pennispora]ORX67035.1 general substrate transporter [Linderina pennispora]